MINAWLRAAILVSTASPIALIGELAWAQAQSTSRVASDAEQSGGSTEEGLQEIVVTAQRRSESIQDVPISITAITPTQIQDRGLVTTQDLQLVTPGLTFTNDQSYSAPYIRGIGTSLATPGIENAVAAFVDGAYITRSAGAVTNLFDESVEVLNGAQGTLYGRNATGGALLYQTADPIIGKFGVNIVGEYGSYDHGLGELVVNAPLTDTLALRVALQGVYQGGYVTNLVTGQRNLGQKSDQTARVKLKWVPTDDFSAVASFSYTKGLDHTDFYQERLPAPYCGSCGIPVPGANLNPVSGFYNATNNPASTPYDSYSATGNLRLQYSGDKFDLSSVTSLEQDRTSAVVDTGMASTFSLFDYDYALGGRTYGEELQATSKLDGTFNGMIGFSFNHDKGYINAILEGLAFDPLTDVGGKNPVTTDSYSGFAEAYITPINKLKITLGLRYTADSRTLIIDDTANGFLALDNPSDLTLGHLSLHKNFSAPTGRAVIDYELDPVNLYASWNRGFKAGGFNTPAFASESPVAEEKIDDYELGAKYLSGDRRLRASVGAFYYRYRNMQVQIVSPQTNGLILQNAATARGYGAEFNIDYATTSWLNVFGTLSSLNARFSSYPNAAIVDLQPGVGLISGTENLSGTPLPQAPDVTSSVGFDFHEPITAALAAHLNLIARYSSSYLFYAGGGGPQNFASQPAYTIVNISGGMRTELPESKSVVKSYDIGFFIYNATDKRYYATRDVQAGEGAYDVAAPPLTFGLRLSAAF